MANRYAPALFLEVLAFWFVLRWLLVARLVLFFGRILLLMMLVGVLGSLDEHRFAWAASFAGSALLAWWLLRRWRNHGIRRRWTMRWPRAFAWRGWSGDAISVLCERRLGIKVDAAAPATVVAEPPAQCILALAGDGVWVLEDESGLRHPQVGRVLACWDRDGLVAHVEHSPRS